MALVTTSDGARLNESAAASYERLNAAFLAHFGKRLYISSGARTHAQQVQAFTDNHQLTPIKNNGRYITRKWNGQTWYLKPGKATVATPGTSAHEYPPGRAADFGSGVATRGSREHNWMRANAGRFGWTWTGEHFVTVEPWHWEHTSSGSASGGSETGNEDDMSALAEQQIDAVYKALFGPNNGDTATTKPLGWRNVYGDAQASAYGLLPIAIHNQTLIAAQAGRLAAIEEVVEQLATGSGASIDMNAVARAAERGTKAALSGLTLTAEVDE